MKDNDKDLETALDDIFGSDFIEIDVNGSKEDDKLSNNETELDVIHVKKEEDTKIEMPTNSTSMVSQKVTNNLKNEPAKNQSIINEEKNDSKENINNVNKEKLNKKKQKNKKMIIWIIIYSILISLLIFILVKYVFGVTKVVNCSSMAEDEGYKYTDEYKITYKKNSINFIENTYKYTALTDEFKSQIEYIKQDKLLYIVNSNGMPGFTYLYEISDDFIKIDGYFDFGLIEFSEIDKINQEEMPLFPIKINSKTNFKNLKKNLENEGYKCIPSK